MDLSLTDRQPIRELLRKKRCNLSVLDRQKSATRIATKIIALPLFQHSQHIAVYMATDGEIDPTAIIAEALRQQKNYYLPVLSSQQTELEFYTYHTQDVLKKNRYGIGEPDIKTQHRIASTELDLVLIPLVAFDIIGNRLGRGAGYYDRTFAFLGKSTAEKKPKRPVLIGLAYDFQKIDHIIPATWDVPLDMIVTEKNIYRC